MSLRLTSDDELARYIESGLTQSEIGRAIGVNGGDGALYRRLSTVATARGLEITRAYRDRKATMVDKKTAQFIQADICSSIKLAIPDGMVIVASDCHWADPAHIPLAHKALCNLITEYRSDIKAVILNGDLSDMGSISRHGPNRWIKPRDVAEELRAIQSRTAEIESALGPGKEKIRLWGNHDERFELRLANMASEFRGVPGFRLKHHLPAWDEAWTCEINDDFIALHSWHNGRHAGYNNVTHGMCHVATGHTHHLLCRHKAGFKGTYYGIETGMVADPDQPEFNYRKGTPSDWHPGFVALTFYNGRLLYPEFCAIQPDGTGWFRGRRFI